MSGAVPATGNGAARQGKLLLLVLLRSSATVCESGPGAAALGGCGRY